MWPRIGVSVTWATSSADETEVSISSRSTAMPIPARRPSTRARPRLRVGCGETGLSATWALSTIDALIRASLFPFGVSMSTTRSLSALA